MCSSEPMAPVTCPGHHSASQPSFLRGCLMQSTAAAHSGISYIPGASGTCGLPHTAGLVLKPLSQASSDETLEDRS